jgi:MFS transporter, MFS domain-containing protein family, molybdate-anion transporter
MWVPTLMAASPGTVLPTGLVFSSFMLAMTFGGMLFAILLPFFAGGAEGLCVAVFVVAALAMSVPVFAFDFQSILASFLVLETMVGMFNSCGATLRSQYYPDSMQSSIMSVFRLPLNILVVIGTKLANSASSESAFKAVFCVVVVMHGIAAVLQLLALQFGPPTDVSIHFDGLRVVPQKGNKSAKQD